MDKNTEEVKHEVQVSTNNEENEGDCYDSIEEYFVDCCRYGDLDDVIETLKEGEVDINWFDDNLNTAVHMASANGHLKILEQLIAYEKEGKKILNLNARNAEGCTALHWAVINNKVEVIDLLLAAGADCNIQDKSEKTPLDLACEVENFDIAEKLAKNTKPSEEDLKEPEVDYSVKNEKQEEARENDDGKKN